MWLYDAHGRGSSLSSPTLFFLWGHFQAPACRQPSRLGSLPFLVSQYTTMRMSTPPTRRLTSAKIGLAVGGSQSAGPRTTSTAIAMAAPAAVTSRVRQLYSPDPAWWENLVTITIPTLIIGGGATSHIPQEKLAEVAHLIPDCRLVTIEGAGHTIHFFYVRRNR